MNLPRYMDEEYPSEQDETSKQQETLEQEETSEQINGDLNDSDEEISHAPFQPLESSEFRETKRLLVQLDPQSDENPKIAQQLLETEMKLFANILQKLIRQKMDTCPQVYWGRIDMLGIMRFGSDQSRSVRKIYISKANDQYRSQHAHQTKESNSGSVQSNQRASQPVSFYWCSVSYLPQLVNIKPPHENNADDFWHPAQNSTSLYQQGCTDPNNRSLTIRNVSHRQPSSASHQQEDVVVSSHSHSSAPVKVEDELKIPKKPSGSAIAAQDQKPSGSAIAVQDQYQEQNYEQNHGSNKNKNYSEGKRSTDKSGFSSDERVLSSLVDMILNEQDCGCIKKLLCLIKNSWNLQMNDFWKVFSVVTKNREQLLSLMKTTSLDMPQDNACSNTRKRQHGDYDSNDSTLQEHPIVKRRHHDTRQDIASNRGSQSRMSKYLQF